VNVSVEGGTRVEIKGVPRIPDIPRLTHFEALRQANLLELRDELRRRGLTGDSIHSAAGDVSAVLDKTAFSPIARAFERGWRVSAVSLAGFKGLLTFPLQPGRDFASEIADRVRVIACLDELPNIVHSEMVNNPLTAEEWKRIRGSLRARKDDAVVLAWGEARDAAAAAAEILIRAKEACQGIPSETRQAFPSGTNGFERILPGPDRMYPDTDMPPVPLEDARIQRTRARLPLTPWERREALRRLGLSGELVELLAKDARSGLVLKLAETLPLRAAVPAVVLGQTLKHLERNGFPVSRIDDGALTDLFRRFSAGDFAREAFPDILKLAAVEGLSPAESVARLGLVRLPEAAVREIAGIVAGFSRALEPREPGKKLRHLMGILMSELRGKADGAQVAAALAGALEKGR